MKAGRRDTNTTTYFLRESRALEMIRDLVAVPATAAGRRTVLWSVGCSTGDEPFGLAMLCREAGADIEVLATDVNPDALERARSGRYPERNLRHVDPIRRDRWFRRDRDRWEIHPALREVVRFREHDVIREGAPRHDVDVAICRNVMVYFSPAQLRAAVATIIRALRPGGLLILGASEWLRADLRAREASQLRAMERAGVIVYQRTDGEVVEEPDPALRPTIPARPAEWSAKPEPRDPVAELRAAGDAHLDAGRPEEARLAYQRALAEAPLLADLHLRIALSHLHARELQPAHEALRRALFLTPELWPAWLLMADLAHHSPHERRYLDHARALLESAATPDLDGDPILRPFAQDRRAALEAVRRRLLALR
jgi:chemotaxis methyl-accepting protein methylase